MKSVVNWSSVSLKFHVEVQVFVFRQQRDQHPQQSGADGLQGGHQWSFCRVSVSEQ